MTIVSDCDLQQSDSVGLDCVLFNLRLLQTKTKTSSALISALQYADDAVFPCLTTDGLQRSPNVIPETFLRARIIVNTAKRDVLGVSSPDAFTFSIIMKQLKNVRKFRILGIKSVIFW